MKCHQVSLETVHYCNNQSWLTRPFNMGLFGRNMKPENQNIPKRKYILLTWQPEKTESIKIRCQLTNPLMCTKWHRFVTAVISNKLVTPFWNVAFAVRENTTWNWTTEIKEYYTAGSYKNYGGNLTSGGSLQISYQLRDLLYCCFWRCCVQESFSVVSIRRHLLDMSSL